MNYTVVKTPTFKTSITITRRELWNNFIESWKDIAWDDYVGVDTIKKVADVLLSGERLETDRVRELFRDGYTFLLMGDAMTELENGADGLQEVVIDDDGELTIVSHEDIVY